MEWNNKELLKIKLGQYSIITDDLRQLRDFDMVVLDKNNNILYYIKSRS